MLHCYCLSPAHTADWQQCLQLLQPKDRLLLCEDAVLLAARPDPVWQQLKLAAVQVFALAPDCQARGLNPELLPVQLVDFDGFVMLCESHYPILTWR